MRALGPAVVAVVAAAVVSAGAQFLLHIVTEEAHAHAVVAERAVKRWVGNGSPLINVGLNVCRSN